MRSIDGRGSPYITPPIELLKAQFRDSPEKVMDSGDNHCFGLF